MSDFIPLKLFKLPRLAYDQVILTMGLAEMFNISFCSKRVLGAIKSANRHKHCSWKIEFQGRLTCITDVQSAIEVDWCCWLPDLPISGTIGGYEFIREMKADYTSLDFPVPGEGWILVIKYIEKMYGKSANSVVLDDVPPERIFEIKTEFIEKFIIARPDISEEEVREFTDRMPFLKYLEFSNSGIGQLTWEVEEMKINGHRILDVNQLLRMRCPYLTIESSCMSNENLNVYLKKWIAGELPYIKHHTFEVSNFEVHRSLDGIQWDINLNRVLKIENRNQTAKRRSLQYAFDFQSASGIQATCFLSNHARWYMIDFVVWE